MASGLVALLDDIAGIARLAAVSLDDVAAASTRVGLKAAGVVVDDTAVAPRYVTGLSPARELPIIARIGLGSLRNKLLILLPAALLLSAVAPWAVTPLLMLGGTYLCFEGAEKIIEAALGHGGDPEEAAGGDAKAMEDRKVKGAVRTDLILSGEIMAISLADVADRPLGVQAAVLAIVGVALTLGVYGVVAVIVKLDDMGLHLARRGPAAVRGLGRGLVRLMPAVMGLLSGIGTAAMLWVGGGILVHGLEAFGVELPAHALAHAAETAAGAVPTPLAEAAAWAVSALGAGLLGLVLGGAVAVLVAGVGRLAKRVRPAG